MDEYPAARRAERMLARVVAWLTVSGTRRPSDSRTFTRVVGSPSVRGTFQLIDGDGGDWWMGREEG